MSGPPPSREIDERAPANELTDPRRIVPMVDLVDGRVPWAEGGPATDPRCDSRLSGLPDLFPAIGLATVEEERTSCPDKWDGRRGPPGASLLLDVDSCFSLLTTFSATIIRFVISSASPKPPDGLSDVPSVVDVLSAADL